MGKWKHNVGSLVTVKEESRSRVFTIVEANIEEGKSYPYNKTVIYTLMEIRTGKKAFSPEDRLVRYDSCNPIDYLLDWYNETKRELSRTTNEEMIKILQKKLSDIKFYLSIEANFTYKN
jgi:hypothetical protein